MRKQSRSFKPGQTIHTAQAWLQDVLGGELGEAVKITVENDRAELDIASVCAGLNVATAHKEVADFVAYRRHEIGKPIKSDSALKRLLNQFEGNPTGLIDSIQQSMAQGWQGLFKKSDTKSQPKRSRAY